jgi:hypothetical protein
MTTRRKPKVLPGDLEETLILHLPVSLDKILSLNNTQGNYIQKILSEKPMDVKARNQRRIVHEDHIESNIKTHHYNDKSNKQIILKVYDLWNNVISDNFGDEPDKKGVITLYGKDVQKLKLIKVSVACWWCCHTFDTYPVFYPIKYIDKTDIFMVKGCYCSFNCVLGSMMKDRNTDISLLSYLHRRLIGVGLLSKIKPAPAKEILQMFGGPICIDKYRKSFTNFVKYHINVLPMVFLPQQLEEHTINELLKKSIDQMKANKIKNVLLDEKNVTNGIKRLSLESRNTGNIKNLMGMTMV